MTVLELITALLKTRLSIDSTVCIESAYSAPFHIQSVKEDSKNTGIIIICPSLEYLQESEVGYK